MGETLVILNGDLPERQIGLNLQRQNTPYRVQTCNNPGDLIAALENSPAVSGFLVFGALSRMFPRWKLVSAPIYEPDELNQLIERIAICSNRGQRILVADYMDFIYGDLISSLDRLERGVRVIDAGEFGTRGVVDQYLQLLGHPRPRCMQP